MVVSSLLLRLRLRCHFPAVPSISLHISTVVIVVRALHISYTEDFVLLFGIRIPRTIPAIRMSTSYQRHPQLCVEYERMDGSCQAPACLTPDQGGQHDMYDKSESAASP